MHKLHSRRYHSYDELYIHKKSSRNGGRVICEIGTSSPMIPAGNIIPSADKLMFRHVAIQCTSISAIHFDDFEFLFNYLFNLDLYRKSKAIKLMTLNWAIHPLKKYFKVTIIFVYVRNNYVWIYVFSIRKIKKIKNNFFPLSSPSLIYAIHNKEEKIRVLNSIVVVSSWVFDEHYVFIKWVWQ